MNDSVDVEELHDLVVDYFGSRLQFPYFGSKDHVVGGVLYETYELECRLDEQRGSFRAAIKVGPRLSTTEFFGREVSWDPTPESILKSLSLIDRWCRAHLPEAFLSEYERNG